MNAIVAVEAFIAFVLAITIHEAAHAAMASTLGDSTAASRGRLSLWPPRQMATIGTLVAIILIFSGIPAGVGWGKPVEIDERKMRVGPDLGMAIVAIAGPLANLLLGVLLALALRFVPHYGALSTASLRCVGQGAFLQQCLSHAQPIYLLRIEQFVVILAVTNILLAILNVIPLYPLDGYSVLFALLPGGAAVRYRNWRGYMEFLLLVFFFLVPFVFRLIGIAGLDPAVWLTVVANVIGLNISGGAFAFYPLL
jgi:Zn-dependent protease